MEHEVYGSPPEEQKQEQEQPIIDEDLENFNSARPFMQDNNPLNEEIKQVDFETNSEKEKYDDVSIKKIEMIKTPSPASSGEIKDQKEVNISKMGVLMQQSAKRQYNVSLRDINKRRKTFMSRKRATYDNSASEDELGCKDTVASQQDTGAISYMDTQGNTTELLPNMRLKSHKKLFTGLLKQTQIITMFPIVSLIITYDSSRAITVTKKNDQEYFVKMYDLESYELTFEELYEGTIIKFKDVEQRADGKYYAAVFNDDGRFYMRIFGKETRTDHQIRNQQVDINAILAINAYTMCNEMFPDPNITCCFTSDNTVFVNLFHSWSLNSYHFIWNLEKRKLVGQLCVQKLDCNMKNFPYKSFYSEENNEIYSFFRQGQSITINANDSTNYRTEQITKKDLGQMTLVYGQAMIARSSSQVLFFKQTEDKMTKEFSWKLYHTINKRAFVYYIKGNIRIQITTDDNIYFYLINKHTLMPELENVMMNYMSCNQMMFGSKVRYGISFKLNERCFNLYRRKYQHNLKVCVDDENFENSKGLALPKLNLFLVSRVSDVLIYDSKTYQRLGKIPIKLFKSEEREPNEIIGYCASKDNEWVAIISGKNLIREEQQQNQLFIFQRVGDHEFEQKFRVVLKDKPEFKKVCMQFEFKNYTDVPNTIIFVKQTCIFELNYHTEVYKEIVEFYPPFKTQPIILKINDKQNIYVCTSIQDGYLYSATTGKQCDIDDQFDIELIKSVIFDEEEDMVYMLCNKKKGQLGMFLIKFYQHDLNDHEFVISRTAGNRSLDIDSVTLTIIRGQDENSNQKYKEIIIGYKTIYINTFCVEVNDISEIDEDEKKTITSTIHESFQLWESEVNGFFIDGSKDFIILNKLGLNIISLGQESKRVLIDNYGMSRMIHSLDSYNYLKIDKQNMLNFKCQDYNNREVWIDQEYCEVNKWTMNLEVNTYNIYKVKIFDITLRELLIIQSLYLCSSQAEISNLVKIQPNPTFFYKAFLELDMSTLVSILSFDSRSLDSLLNDKNSQYFNIKFPIIYKNKIQKRGKNSYYFRTAFDQALRNNQVKAVNKLIEYIVKYQNNYVSAQLFYKQIPIMLAKGVSLKSLFQSEVFQYSFDFDEWPSVHLSDRECIQQFPINIFDIRNNYQKVFTDPDFQYQNLTEAKFKNSKAHKIKYTINLIPKIGEHLIEDPQNPGQTILVNKGICVLDLLQQSSELELFGCQTILDFVDFQWEAFGQRHHATACLFHIFYVAVFVTHVICVYIQGVGTELEVYFLVGMLIGIAYPLVYECVQLKKQGLRSYAGDVWNYTDVVYLFMSVINVLVTLAIGPLHALSRGLMSIITLLIISKTMFFLRIVGSFSPVVIMVTSVLRELRVYMVIYFFIAFVLSLMFNVLGVGLLKNDDPESSIGNVVQTPEYAILGNLVGQVIQSVRLSQVDPTSIGPYKISISLLGHEENILFWLLWVFGAILTNVIYLNFIVAEVMNIYGKVTLTLGQVKTRERASMIAESEYMTWMHGKAVATHPQFIIKRSTTT